MEHCAHTHYIVGKSRKHYAKWKKPDLKEHIYDSIYIDCPEEVNPQRQKLD